MACARWPRRLLLVALLSVLHWSLVAPLLAFELASGPPQLTLKSFGAAPLKRGHAPRVPAAQLTDLLETATPDCVTIGKAGSALRPAILVTWLGGPLALGRCGASHIARTCTARPFDARAPPLRA